MAAILKLFTGFLSMATIKTNIGEVTDRIRDKLAMLGNKDYIPRTLSFDLIDLMTRRIHIDGKAADDSQIGTYSSSYMVLRTGTYKNSGKGNAGFFTKGGRATSDVKTRKLNSARPSYNRSSDTKIIVSLTRQLENDWNVIATDEGYGIGFLNPLNFQKARWVEANKGKKIFSLSPSEQQYVNDTVNQLVKDALA